MIPSPLRVRLDGGALVHNWQALDRMSGAAPAGAAVKADGYGLGARDVVRRLAAVGCRDFFVATWNEAQAIAAYGLPVSVLHGLRAEDIEALGPANIRPVLNTPEQVLRWREVAGGAACDVMVDTGMNRLGLSPEEAASGLLDQLNIETLMSHLASADEDSPMNVRQRDALTALHGKTGARRLSLANSAGIALGTRYAFGLTRPGLALYGGVPRPELQGKIRQVAYPEAQILQRRRVAAGDTIGYNATFTAPCEMEVATLNIGYADGYLRSFSGKGHAWQGGTELPVLGRVSMDLLVVDVSKSPGLGEGDWVSIGYALPETAEVSGLSQYELLTGLGRRFERMWES